MSKKNFMFKSHKELYIFYNYANRRKLFTNVYYQKEGNLYLHISKCTHKQVKITKVRKHPTKNLK